MALLVFAVAWSFMVLRGTVDIVILIMIYIIFGFGLNVVVGFFGLLVLGYGGFYVIGVYIFALFNYYYGLGFWICLSIVGLMVAAAGFLFGFSVLRLRGDYLAIVIFGFGEIVRILLFNNIEIIGGSNGIS